MLMLQRKTIQAGIIAVIGAIVAFMIVILATGPGEPATGESTVTLEESGARSGQFAQLSSASFSPEVPSSEALSLARDFVREGMNLDDVESLPARIASARFSGQRHDNGMLATDMSVRVVVFHEYPAWPNLPAGYSGPRPIEPRYTVVIDDNTRDVVFSVLTWGKEGE